MSSKLSKSSSYAETVVIDQYINGQVDAGYRLHDGLYVYANWHKHNCGSHCTVPI